MRFIHSVVRAVMNSNGSLAALCFCRVHLARAFERARDLDTKITQYWRAGLCSVVVDEDIVAVSAQSWLATNELPNLIESRTPRRANRSGRNLAAHGRQLAGADSLDVNGYGHSSSVNRIATACRPA